MVAERHRYDQMSDNGVIILDCTVSTYLAGLGEWEIGNYCTLSIIFIMHFISMRPQR